MGKLMKSENDFFSWVPTCCAAEYRQETIGRCTFSRNASEFHVLTLEDSRNVTEQAGGLFRSTDDFFWVLKIGATQPF
jgi:hypothetical protein